MLPEKKQKLYRLYYIEKKSYKEISDINNVKESAVRMQYARLRREIKDLTHEFAEHNFDLDVKEAFYEG